MVAPTTSEELFRQLLETVENQHCYDCGKKSVQWASINQAIYLCQGCSGLHRSFGVHVSSVRSLAADTWSEKQLRYMTFGGNEEFREFMKKYRIPAQPPDRKYHTVAARYYRLLMQSRVEGTECEEDCPGVEQGAQTASNDRIPAPKVRRPSAQQAPPEDIKESRIDSTLSRARRTVATMQESFPSTDFNIQGAVQKTSQTLQTVKDKSSAALTTAYDSTVTGVNKMLGFVGFSSSEEVKKSQSEEPESR